MNANVLPIVSPLNHHFYPSDYTLLPLHPNFVESPTCSTSYHNVAI